MPAFLETAIQRKVDQERFGLRLHLFGVKLTALKNKVVRDLAWSADSMLWSFAARGQGRNANDWREAQAFVEKGKEKFCEIQSR